MSAPTWYKKLTDFPSNKENPFLEQAVADMKVSVRCQAIRPSKASGGEGRLLLVDGLGEEHGEATFIRQIEVDEAQFTKIYLEGIPAISGLSARGTKVWGYVCHQLQPGKTSIHFMLAQYLEFTGYKSRANVLSGLAELLEADIIARSTDSSLYFINPLIMFNGNRVTFAKSYIKKKLVDKSGSQLQLGFNATLDHLRELANAK